jgi:ribosomal protein S18 acetylase RimI-like enzyme
MPTIKYLKSLNGYVYEYNDIILGYLLYHYSTNITNPIIMTNTISFSDYCYLDYIGINPDFQGNCIGQMLIKKFNNYLDFNNLTSILHVEENTNFTDKLIKWYERNEYIIFGKSIPSDDKEGIYLTLMIRKSFL